MKILSLTHKSPYPPKDGGAIGIYNIAVGIARNNSSIHILSMNTTKHKVENAPSELAPGCTISFVDVDTTIKPFNALVNLFFSKLPYNAVRFISDDYAKALLNILKKEQFDIIQLEGPYVYYCLPLIKKYSKAKICLRAHNIEHEIWDRSAAIEDNIVKKWYFRLLAKRMKKLELSLINKYDFLVPVTAKDLEFFNAHGNSKPCMVMPAGILFKEFNENFKFRKAIFSIGALDWLPNQDALKWFVENVMPLLKNKIPDIQFNVAGRQSPLWFREYLSANKIVFCGEVEDAASFMISNGIMVVPLLSGSGIRVKILEAMALGIPIVSTTIGVEGIDCQNGRDILIADTAEDFADRISELLNNPELTYSISQKAKEIALNKYNTITITGELLYFYRTN